jgi:pimeloyl-ACP methyl ester carboxylesterase
MKAIFILLVSALTLRSAGAAIRVKKHGLPILAVGWLLCTIGVWMAAGAMGAWFPLWPVLVLGAIGALSDSRKQHARLWIVSDIIVIVVCGLFSIPPLKITSVAGTALVAAGIGFCIDSLLVRSSKRMRAIALALLLIPFLVIGLTKPRIFRNGVRLLADMVEHNRLFYVGLTPAHKGKRVVLSTGAVAWLDRPQSKKPFWGAIFFHGAHSNASRQASAIIVRRALVEAGFTVLAVDHPGYGDSPNPSADAGVDEWDPLPTALAALDLFLAISDVQEVIAVGHSMGAVEVLRLLSISPRLRAAVLCGAALINKTDSPERANYWYNRFHTERKMRGRLSADKVLKIRKRFYGEGRFVSILDNNHPPIVLVQFGSEWPEIVAGRKTLYDALPGQKTIWDLSDSTHYFSSYGVAELVLGDTSVTRALASKFRLLTS